MRKRIIAAIAITLGLAAGGAAGIAPVASASPVAAAPQVWFHGATPQVWFHG